MKSIFFIFVVIILCFHDINGKIPKEVKDIINQNCGDEIKAVSPEEKEKIDEYIPPETEAGKCYLKCIFDHTGMTKDGKLNLDSMKVLIAKVLPDLNVRNIMVEIATDCMKKENNFESLVGCETANAYLRCAVGNTNYTIVKNYINGRN
ncbi:uncharacterized protein LOC142331104 [Lycorma delicatula]|uniref:uncharacterized protein LOC142331104 n=1 Tax=Lycorma delicatula TaxID=130591 RepID=UPI003F519A03